MDCRKEEEADAIEMLHVDVAEEKATARSDFNELAPLKKCKKNAKPRPSVSQ
jgi:hypothetical protein